MEIAEDESLLEKRLDDGDRGEGGVGDKKKWPNNNNNNSGGGFSMIREKRGRDDQGEEEEEEKRRGRKAAEERVAEMRRRFEAMPPFAVRSPEELSEAREMRSRGDESGCGWTLKVLHALGLLDTEAQPPGRCLGCYIPHFAAVRLMQGVAAALPGNVRTVYLSSPTRIDLRGGGSVASPGSLDLVREAFSSNPALESALCAVDMATATGQGHEALVRFARRAAAAIEVSLLDVYHKSDEEAQRVMVEYLNDDGLLPPFRAAAPRGWCKGFILSSIGKHSHAPDLDREPPGYCQTWTTAALACSLAVDGADENEVAMDLLCSFAVDGEAGLRGFVRTVSTCIVREYVRNRTEDSICGFECCPGVGCCADPEKGRQ